MEPNIVENVMIADKLKPHNANIKDVSTVEENMSIEVNHINHWQNCENNEI